ncbi:MAG TPA: hypothetical protein VJ812_06885 [Gemmatimonadaceae bacterium]|jgi:hypothetical protein|nr:hypothetical protein [Gemmatimonadaceae bacterium]
MTEIAPEVATTPTDVERLKESVREHWQRQPCGTRDIPVTDRARFFAELGVGLMPLLIEARK